MTTIIPTVPMLAEWLAIPQPNDKTFAYLADHGISMEATMRAGGVGIAKVNSVGALWHRDEAGQSALILPVFEHPAPSIWHAEEEIDLSDLIALSPTDPEMWWRRRGRGSGLLGCEYLEAHETGEPMQVFGSPLDWLKADCQGVVFLEWAANLRDRRRLRQEMEIAA